MMMMVMVIVLSVKVIRADDELDDYDESDDTSVCSGLRFSLCKCKHS